MLEALGEAVPPNSSPGQAEEEAFPRVMMVLLVLLSKELLLAPPPRGSTHPRTLAFTPPTLVPPDPRGLAQGPDRSDTEAGLRPRFKFFPYQALAAPRTQQVGMGS